VDQQHPHPVSASFDPLTEAPQLVLEGLGCPGLGDVTEDAELLHELIVPGHRAHQHRDGEDRPAPAEGDSARRLLELLGRTPFAPPSLPEAMREAGAGPEVLRALAKGGELVRLSDDVAFTREAYAAALELVRRLVAAEGGVTVPRLRDAMAASRRPVLAFLEHLDAERVTRREGDVRTLR